MQFIRCNPRLLVFVSESRGININWNCHHRDEKKYAPFCAYIGGRSKGEIEKAIASLELETVVIRKAKRLKGDWTYEAKIKGAPYEDVRNIGFYLNQSDGIRNSSFWDECD